MSKKITGVKGMEDLYDAAEIKKWHWIEASARNLFERAGFQEIRTPIVEDADLFERSVGDTTEIVEKEMYTLLDRNENRLALRPEGTASVVRAFIEHFTDHNIHEGRFYYMGPMYRYERPQKGRYRQFFQIGAEVFGFDHPLADAELIGLNHQLFTELGLTNIKLKLNSLGFAEEREKYRKALTQFLDKVLDTLCEDCQRRIKKNPLRALDCKKEVCIVATQRAPMMLEYLSPESSTHFEQVQAGLKAQKIPFEITPRLVRGLDYYEKTVFEFTSDELGAQNSVAAGGRYNDLVHDLGGPQIPAVGFAIGMERLVALLGSKPGNELLRPRVYLIGLDEDSNRELFQTLLELRQAGVIAELDFGGSSLKSKMRRASRWNAQWVVILGENERSNGIAILRNMEDGAQEEIPLAELFIKLISRFPTLHYSR